MKTIEELSVELEESYAFLTVCVREQADQELKLAGAEAWLTESRRLLLVQMEPKELGQNEAQREAKLYTLCQKENDALEKASERRISLRAKTEQARLRVEAARCQLRIAELGAGFRLVA